MRENSEQVKLALSGLSGDSQGSSRGRGGQ